ncbi:MAG: M23 family metallopeptidase [Azoarcus sp.]|jgi:murein DD-endopeptidase MepM/ murein hydrolase activator NlpD|nr:M23 family metallopeptidase [Azoarcus sp.]
MRNSLILLLLACQLAAAQDSGGEYPFWIERHKSSQDIRFIAVNNSPAVVTLFFGVAGSHFNADKDLPQTLVIEPGTARDIVRITQVTRWDPINIQYRYSFQPGDAFMPPDSHARYHLPFQKGTPFLVVQEPGSLLGAMITHNSDYSRYAIDFGVSEGTLVTAAREGIVIDTKDTFTVGRPDPSFGKMANYVAIMHADRTIAYYVHLAPRGVFVKPGQQVHAGEAIAYSGNTGFTYGPHLHFDVRRAAVSEAGEVVLLSEPVDFYQRDGTGEKIEIIDGMLIKAQ